MTTTAAFWRDANRVPITGLNLVQSNSKTLSGNNTTVVTPIFGITGTVMVTGIWAIVTTVLGANHTASAFRLNDQTSQLDITLSTGTDISAATVGSMIIKKGLAATAITYKSAAAGAVSEPTTLETQIFSPIVLQQKTGGIATNIEYVYATTDAPTSGVIEFFVAYLPLSDTATITNL